MDKKLNIIIALLVVLVFLFGVSLLGGQLEGMSSSAAKVPRNAAECRKAGGNPLVGGVGGYYSCSFPNGTHTSTPSPSQQ